MFRGTKKNRRGGEEQPSDKRGEKCESLNRRGVVGGIGSSGGSREGGLRCWSRQEKE